MKGKMISKKLLIIDSCLEEQEKAAIIAREEGYFPCSVFSINQGLRVIKGESWDKVVTVSHMYEGNEMRLGSEVAALCKARNVPCVVCAQVTGIGSVIQDFLYRAKRAGASCILQNKNWKFAICYNV